MEIGINSFRSHDIWNTCRNERYKHVEIKDIPKEIQDITEEIQDIPADVKDIKCRNERYTSRKYTCKNER